MLPSQRNGRQRKLLLAVVAVASGVTISCSSEGIGAYDAGWDVQFEAAAKKDAANDATPDAADDASDDADAANATDATPD